MISVAARKALPPLALAVSVASFSAMGKGGSGGAAAEAASSASPASAASCHKHLPTIIVLDLDDCLWTPEMHELSGPPSIPVEGPLDPNNKETSPLGTVGMKVPTRRRGGGRGFDWGGYSDNGEEIVELHPGARLVLRELATNPKYKDVKVAVASTSLEPSYSRMCIDGIEVIEGTTMRDMIHYSAIGREGQLTSRKTSHFRLIQEESGGVPYEEMLFFDDCNWQDHVGDLSRAFGVVGVRTPSGLRLEEFHQGLEKFREGKTG